MKTVGERIRYLIDKQGISLRQFCKNNEILYTGMSSIINNEREIGMKVLHQLKKAIPEMDTEWLLFGTDRDEGISKYYNTPDAVAVVAEPEPDRLSWDKIEKLVMDYLDSDKAHEKIAEIYDDALNNRRRKRNNFKK